ncbi:MAG: UDP-4-amino-4,6-dideoxy-N-acetyl-beta-L-altrosamine transaminase [bacterium]|nr:UDP-4-amino-4,6-dideoxy-N-acetyl-beta-L-altrosamine transaminase [bacterium]
MPLPYSRQTIGADEIAAVAHAAGDPFLTGGPGVARFERALAEAVGARHAIAVSSGTAALHVAYLAAGLRPGDRVVTSPITFVATANAAVHCGAEVAFGDVDARGNLDAAGVGQAVARAGAPALVVPVHYAGHPADVAALAATVPGAVVVEDACHALGAVAADGRPVGACTHAALAVFSFHPVKIITTGEGGAITTNDDLLARRCRRLRDHGLVREAAERGVVDEPWGYEMHEPGFNYRLTDLQAALGTVQLGRLRAFVAARRTLAARYAAALRALPGVALVAPAPGTESSWHLLPVRLPASARRHVYAALRARAIGVQVHYVPVHRQPFYRQRGAEPAHCPAAEAFYAEELSLPCFPGMTDEDVTRVVDALGEALAAAPSPEKQRPHEGTPRDAHPAW